MGKTFSYREGTGDKKSFLRSKLNVKRAFKKDGENVYDWIPFTAFGSNADYIQKYVNAGDIISIQGEIQISDNYEKDGKTIYGQPFVLVDAVSIISSNNGEKSEGGAAKSSSSKSSAPAKKSSGFNPLEKFRAKK